MRPLLALSLGKLIFICLAVWSFLQWRDKQRSLPACEMTYNYNGYVKQASPLLLNSSGYTLHLYREAVVQYGAQGPPNIPVLFIPGNAGRHMQGRSLASESGRQWATAAAEVAAATGARSPSETSVVNLDWYMVDTLEQLSAFHGEVLEAQVQYVVSCLRYLRYTYGLQGGSHMGVVVVGHSMGGLVARAAVARAAQDPELGPDLVSLLLTLATPHQRPPLPSHPSLHRFYSKLAALPQPPVPLVSLAGGYNDTEVAAALTELHGITDPQLSLHTSLEAVPGVWASAHHNCIVWCNQLTIRLAELLLGLARELKVAAVTDATQGQGSAGPGTGAGGAGSGGGPVSAGETGGGARDQAEAGGKVQRPGGTLAPSSFQARRNALVLIRTREVLLGARLRSQLLLPDAPATGLTGNSSRQRQGRGQGAGAGPGAGKRSLGEVLEGAAGRQCGGANLAWYMQYNKPRGVTRALLQLKHSSIKEGLGKTGRIYHWPLNASDADSTATSSAGDTHTQGPRSWSLLVSASKPCTGFRVWLLRDAGTHPDDQLGRDVDVTHMVVRLPPLHPVARQRVRDFSDADMVMKGKDYEAAAGWVLRLPPDLLQGASGIALWLGSVTIRKAFHLTAQVAPEPDATPTTPEVGLFQRHSPALLPPGHTPLVSTVALRAPPPLLRPLLSWRMLALRVVSVASVPAKQRQQQERAGERRAPPRKCLSPVVAIVSADGMSERITANLTSFNLAFCAAHSGQPAAGVAGAGQGGARGPARAAVHVTVAPGACSAVLLLDPGCAYEVSVVPDPATPLTEVLLQRLPLMWAVAQAVLILGLTHVPHAVAADADACRDAPSASAQEKAVQRVLCACLMHGMVVSGVVMAVLQVPVLWAALTQAGHGPLASLQRGALAQLGALMGPVGAAWASEAWDGLHGLLGVPVGRLVAFAALTPVALRACCGAYWGAAWQHALAVALVAAAVLLPVLNAPVAATPSAAFLQADEVALLLLSVLFLLTFFGSALDAVASVLNRVLAPVSWLVSGRPAAKVAPGQASSSQGGDASEAWPAGTAQGGQGAVRGGAGSTGRRSRRSVGLLALGALLFVVAALTLHEQVVTCTCLVILLLAVYLPHQAWGLKRAVAGGRLWLLLLFVGAVVSMPSLVAWVQLQRDVVIATQGEGAVGTGAARRGLLAPCHHKAWQLGGSSVEVWDTAGQLVQGVAGLVVSYRLLTGAGQRVGGQAHALLARAVAVAGLACAALGVDWAPYLVQTAAAVLAALP